MHIAPAEQTVPQSPQLLGSFVTSMHAPQQHREPLAHAGPLAHLVGVHCPSMQALPTGQA
jgi:hypothetical protein